jgi:hypothetical protein
MKPVHQVCAYAILGGGLFVASAAAQSAAPAPAPQQQSAPADNPYTGVSNPPPDDTIVATPEVPPPAPPPPAAKPSPVVAAQPAPPPPAQPSDLSPDPASNDNDSSRWDGTDYGIVTPNAPQSDNPPPSADVALHRRYNPDNDIVNVVPDVPNALAEGTNIRIRLLQSLSTNTTEQGTPFRGTVIADVYREGRVIIPAGAEMRGRVTSSHPGHHLGSRATLRLTPELVLLPDGTAYHLDAQVVYTAAPHTRTTEEGTVQPEYHLKKDAAEYGVGVGAGVLAGAQFGPEGALVGSLVGAGIITAHLLIQHPNAVEIPQNAEVVFSLTQPMELTPTRN